MKKQLLIAAVAATMGTAAIADIAITGNAKYEIFNTERTTVVDTNESNTEVNLKVTGKTGDTTVVANFEFSNQSAADGGAAGMDIEDMYMTTKIGMVNVKAGNWATGTGAVAGEIDEGGRATSKIDLSTTVSGVKVYAGMGDAAHSVTENATATGLSDLNTNMYYGVSIPVSGWTVQLKATDQFDEAYGIKGSVNGLGVRLESKHNDQAGEDDVTFGHLTYSVSGVDLAYAWLDSDVDAQIGESDSAIFAVENNGSGKSNSQISAKTTLAGNTVTVKAGTIGHAETGLNDDDYAQVSASRALGSGATATVTYTDRDDRATGDNTNDTQVLELDLSVKF
jgi:hypothetical protein